MRVNNLSGQCKIMDHVQRPPGGIFQVIKLIYISNSESEKGAREVHCSLDEEISRQVSRQVDIRYHRGECTCLAFLFFLYRVRGGAQLELMGHGDHIRRLGSV